MLSEVGIVKNEEKGRSVSVKIGRVILPSTASLDATSLKCFGRKAWRAPLVLFRDWSIDMHCTGLIRQHRFVATRVAAEDVIDIVEVSSKDNGADSKKPSSHFPTWEG